MKSKNKTNSVIFSLNIIISLLRSLDAYPTKPSSEESSHDLSSQVQNLFTALMNSENGKSCLVKWVDGFRLPTDENELDKYMPLIEKSTTPIILTNKPKIPSDSEYYTRHEFLSTTDTNLPIGSMHLKFIQCRVEAIFLGNITTKANVVWSFLQNQMWDNELYDFILLITNPNEIYRGNTFQVVDKIKWVDGFNLHVMNINNRNQINLICFRCHGSAINSAKFNFRSIWKSEREEKEEEFEDGVQIIDKFNQFWYVSHKDRHGIKLYSKKFLPFPEIIHSTYSTTCQPHIFMGKPQLQIIDAYYVMTNACIEMEMVHRFNFTFNGDPFNIPNAIPWRYGYFSQSNALGGARSFAVRKENIVFIDVVPYHFIVVLDKIFIKETNIYALFSSCDTATWIFCSTATLAVTTYLIIFQFNFANNSRLNTHYQQQEQFSFLHQFINMLINMFGNLLSQGFSLTKVVSTKESLYLIIFSLWLLFTIVITNGYSSILSSLMTKPIIPDYPKTLQEIHTMSYPTGMLSREYWYITETETRVQPARPKRFANSTCEYCTYILNSTIYFHYPGEGVLSNFLAFRNEILNAKGDIVLETIAGNRSLGKNFVMIEAHSWDIYRQLLIQGLSKSKLVIKEEKIDEFVKIEYTAVTANYLYALAKGSIHALAEAGIIKKWKDIKTITGQIYYMEQNQRNRQNVTRLIHQIPEDQSKEPEKLGLDVNRIPLTVLGIFLLAAFLVFCIEVLTHFIPITLFILVLWYSSILNYYTLLEF